MQENDTDKKRILIIDDDEMITTLIHQILSKEGHLVSVANNGIDGVKMASEVKPHLIFMDITMPGQDGYDTTEQIKNNPELSEIPIVFLSGQAAGEDKGRVFAKGGSSFIRKPFANQQLVSMVALILDTMQVD